MQLTSFILLSLVLGEESLRIIVGIRKQTQIKKLVLIRECLFYFRGWPTDHEDNAFYQNFNRQYRKDLIVSLTFKNKGIVSKLKGAYIAWSKNFISSLDRVNSDKFIHTRESVQFGPVCLPDTIEILKK